jgi:hypothetical protein
MEIRSDNASGFINRRVVLAGAPSAVAALWTAELSSARFTATIRNRQKAKEKPRPHEVATRARFMSRVGDKENCATQSEIVALGR